MKGKNMKKKSFVLLASGVVAVAILISAMPGMDALTKEGDTTIVNTTTIGNGIRGFKGTTPVKIYIRKNKVIKIEPLANHETPKFFARAKTLLDKYNGKMVSKACKMNVDGVTGATYSSEALKKNVQKGLEYYKKH